VLEDARRLREINCRNVARNRDSWQKFLKKALAQKGAAVPMVMMMMMYLLRRFMEVELSVLVTAKVNVSSYCISMLFLFLWGQKTRRQLYSGTCLCDFPHFCQDALSESRSRWFVS
jgi:hypothetical protein